MEIYAKTTRFALACNASDKIIGESIHCLLQVAMKCVFLEPIQSRCAVLRYSKLTEAQILSRIQEVCDKEAVIILMMCG